MQCCSFYLPRLASGVPATTKKRDQGPFFTSTSPQSKVCFKELFSLALSLSLSLFKLSVDLTDIKISFWSLTRLLNRIMSLYRFFGSLCILNVKVKDFVSSSCSHNCKCGNLKKKKKKVYVNFFWCLRLQ